MPRICVHDPSMLLKLLVAAVLNCAAKRLQAVLAAMAPPISYFRSRWLEGSKCKCSSLITWLLKWLRKCQWDTLTATMRYAALSGQSAMLQVWRSDTEGGQWRSLELVQWGSTHADAPW